MICELSFPVQKSEPIFGVNGVNGEIAQEHVTVYTFLERIRKQGNSF